MLLASLIPPIKGIGIAGKAGIKGAKAAEAATDVSKSVSQTKHVLRYDKVMPALQAAYLHVVKAPITNTICSFKKQWNDLLASIPFVRGSRTWRDWYTGTFAAIEAHIYATADELLHEISREIAQIRRKIEEL